MWSPCNTTTCPPPSPCACVLPGVLLVPTGIALLRTPVVITVRTACVHVVGVIVVAALSGDASTLRD